MFANIYAALNAIKTCPNQIFATVSNHLNVDFRKVLKNVKTVYSGVDLNKWSISSFKENYFSWCGRICKEKDLAEIMDLCAAYNLELKIAGPISDLIYFDEKITPRLKKYKNANS